MSDHYDYDVALDDDELQQPGNQAALDLHLVFQIEDEFYAINVSEVADILPYGKIRKVPKTTDYVKGIWNIRGDIIPIICVRSKFMKPEKEIDFETCIIKVQYEEYSLGLIVDRVIGVETITAAQITPPPSAKLSYANQFIKAIGRPDTGVRMILSMERLIF
ncbi:MAG: chemotaxis protein CheW [Clostridiales bacterium]|jgi:purine-binding chemotaxis protein CheW|nr:chemotaxis protein CheW [Clostridiales bacterium]